MIPLEQLQQEARQEFLSHPAINAANNAIVLQALRAGTGGYEGENINGWLDGIVARAYTLGQQNPLTGYLRQFLNESPCWQGDKMWTDEMLLNFLRIPHTVPKDETV